MSIDFAVEIPERIDAMCKWKNMSLTVSDDKCLELLSPLQEDQTS